MTDKPASWLPDWIPAWFTSPRRRLWLGLLLAFAALFFVFALLDAL